MLFVCHPKILHKHCLQFLLEVKMAQRETENNAYAKLWVNTRPCSNLGGTTLNEGEKGGGQTCDQQQLAVRKASFPLECL